MRRDDTGEEAMRGAGGFISSGVGLSGAVPPGAPG
jgi:hypothetical protein